MVRPRLSASTSIRASTIARRAIAGLRVAVGAISASIVPTPANTHGFGQRYELPLPLSFYLFGGATVVALSFIVFGCFVRRARARGSYRKIDLFANPLGRAMAHAIVVWTLKLAALGLFIITVLAGLFGDQNPYRNIAPTLVWIIWWVGFAYVSALVGNLWALISPWRTAFDWVDWLCRRLGGRGELSFNLPYPHALGTWPGCALLLTFSWIELVYPDPAVPRYIAVLAIIYSILTWGGMFLFGRDTWLRNGEAFGLFFGLFSRLAPTETKAGRLCLRPFGVGFLENGSVSTSKMAFVLLMLATVLYDGLIGTAEWAEFEASVRTSLPALGEYGTVVIKTAGLLSFWLLFLGAYLGISAVMSTTVAGRPAPIEVACTFALTLIPIAIGYHMAHYLVYLVVQGQYIIALLSDPFGRGWDLFGTAGYRVDIALVDARFAWYATLSAIVTGHVAAVYLAHVRAISVFETRRDVLRSQVPLTVLMVIYTFIGLSITAEPIVESREVAAVPSAVTTEVAIPEEAILPDAQSGHLQPVGKNKFARVRLTYKVLGSAFHDGTKTSVADLLYAYAFAYRWGVRSGGEIARYEPFIGAATAPMRQHLVAFRVGGVDASSKSFRVGDVNFIREIFTVDVYLSVSTGDPDWIAAVAPPWSTVPWHVLVLMEEAVARGWAAFSQAEAWRRGVEWLDLVRSKELSARLALLTMEFERNSYRPEALRPYVSADEARKRWQLLTAFYENNGHFLVTNGPYWLKRWSTHSAKLEAFRDLTYPLGVGSYDVYAIPRRGFMTKVDANGDQITISGDIEIINKFQRNYKLVRSPLQSIPSVVVKRAAPECRYVVADDSGRIVLSGVAPVGDGATFQIDFKGRLPTGRYTMSALIAVNGNVVNAEIQRVPIVISSSK
jgi:hypothetical protein